MKRESMFTIIRWYVRGILYKLSGDAGTILMIIKDRRTPERTICNVLQEIYHATKDGRDMCYIRERVIEAELMAKHMDNKLKRYRYRWEDDQ